MTICKTMRVYVTQLALFVCVYRPIYGPDGRIGHWQRLHMESWPLHCRAPLLKFDTATQKATWRHGAV